MGEGESNEEIIDVGNLLFTTLTGVIICGSILMSIEIEKNPLIADHFRWVYTFGS